MTAWKDRQAEVDAAIEAITREYGDTFGLRAFPGDVFMISEGASFWCDRDKVLLYTYVWSIKQNKWLAFAKGTIEELKREIVPFS